VLEAADELPVLTGLNFSTLQKSLRFIKKLENRTISALLVSVPSYYKNRMNDTTLADHFRNLAMESHIPLLLYNFPRFTGIELGADLVRSLAELPSIVGMKDSSGNLIYLQKVLSATEGLEFEVLSGNAETYGLARVLGMQGAILAVSCAVPELAVKLHSTMVNCEEEYRMILRKIHQLSSLIVGSLGIPGVKYAMDLNQLKGDFCRLPLLPLNEGEKVEVVKVMTRVLNNQ
jgi:4-hydroxy-2-oxoglutarate aldolase